MKNNFKVFIIFCAVLTAPILCQAFDQWPDKGQTTLYTNIPGGDSDYTSDPPSYTKLGHGDVELADTATPTGGWIMTRDNVTGLIWELKTDDGSVHDKDNTYTWYDPDPVTNGGNAGTS